MFRVQGYLDPGCPTRFLGHLILFIEDTRHQVRNPEKVEGYGQSDPRPLNKAFKEGGSYPKP